MRKNKHISFRLVPEKKSQMVLHFIANEWFGKPKNCWCL